MASIIIMRSLASAKDAKDAALVAMVRAATHGTESEWRLAVAAYDRADAIGETDGAGTWAVRASKGGAR